MATSDRQERHRGKRQARLSAGAMVAGVTVARMMVLLALGGIASGSLSSGSLWSLASPRAQQESPAPLLRVGTSGDYPPFSLGGEGFEVDVAEALAGALGYRLQWVPFRWPDLSAAVGRGDFDIAMSGITWRASRAAVGWMSRAVAAGGPCVVARSQAELESPDPVAMKVAVNRGGILESWARSRFPADSIQTVDDNLRLPQLLSDGEVGAFVTDSFEVRHFADSSPYRCEPAVDRKVYWISPAGGEQLARRVDRWLEANDALLDRLRLRHFGASARRTQLDHLLDLLARRLAFMPSVGAWKNEHGVAIEDLAREARVLEAVRVLATGAGLKTEAVGELFELQIELAKRIQRRAADESVSLTLDQSRAVLGRLGERIVEALVGGADTRLEALRSADWAPLSKLLESDEIESVRDALAGIEGREVAVAVAKIRALEGEIEQVLAELAPSQRRAVEEALRSPEGVELLTERSTNRDQWRAQVAESPRDEPSREEQPQEDRASRTTSRDCAALSVFDSSDDGSLSGADRFWRHFYLWIDDGDGEIATSELVSVFDAGVRQIRLDLRGYVGAKGTLGSVDADKQVTLEVAIKKRRGLERGLLTIDADGIQRGGGPRILEEDGATAIGFQPLRHGLRIELASGESLLFDC